MNHSEVGTRKHWLWDTARKKNEFLLFSVVLRILQLLITLEPLIQFRWCFQQNVPLQMHNSQLNRKLKMLHVGLQTDFPWSHHTCRSGWAVVAVVFACLIFFLVCFFSQQCSQLTKKNMWKQLKMRYILQTVLVLNLQEHRKLQNW